MHVIGVTEFQTCLISCWRVILLLTWPLSFLYAPKSGSMLWSISCGLMAYDGQKCIIDFQHNTKTMFCHRKASMIGLGSSTMVVQVSRMKNDHAAHPFPLLPTILNVPVTWFWQIGAWPLTRYRSICTPGSGACMAPCSAQNPFCLTAHRSWPNVGLCVSIS